MDPTRKLQDGLSRRWQFGPNDGFLGCDEEMDGPGTFQFWKLQKFSDNHSDSYSEALLGVPTLMG